MFKKLLLAGVNGKRRIYNFNYLRTDKAVTILNDNIIISIDPFNNGNGAKNVLARTYFSDTIRFDLLEYIPEHNDFKWEKT